MNAKTILISLLLFCYHEFVTAQSSKENDFKIAANAIVQKLAKRDSVGLLKYIDKNTGVYILFRIGVQDDYKKYSRIGFSDSNYPKAPFYDGIRMSRLNYENLPSYDCNKWSKTGVFVDTNRIDRLLSKTARRLNLYRKKNIPQKTIESLMDLESKSRRIVIADNKGNELIFYLTFLNNKWYLTIIDKLTTDCSV